VDSKSLSFIFHRNAFTFVFLLLFISFSYALTVVGENGSIVYYNEKLIGAIKDHQLSFEVQLPGVLKLVKPGYVPFEKLITEDGTVIANLALPAYLNISVEPADSMVYIDDKPVARNGTKISLEPGEHLIRITSPGFTEKIMSIYLNPYEEKELNVTLKTTVTLNLDSVKKIENVFFNFEKITIPTVLEVPPGKYRVVLPQDFVNLIQDFEVPSTDTYTFLVDSRQYKKITVLGKPENAIVKIGNDFYKSPVETKLVEGKYEVQISLDGYNDFSTQISLSNDLVLHYTLEPKEQISLLFDVPDVSVEFDGFNQEPLVKRLWFTTIKQLSSCGDSESIIWFGFSDGTLKRLPKSIPIALGKGVQAVVNNTIHTGPGIIQVNPKQLVKVLRGLDVSELIAESPIVLDSTESCLVNIYSRSVLDVFVNDAYIGRTPIYLMDLPAGEYTFTFKKDGNEVHKQTVLIESGKLNEVKVNKSTTHGL